MKDMTDLSEEEQALMAELAIGTESETVTNPFSGESVELCPEAVALYDAIRGAEILGGSSNMDTAIDIFMRRWPEEYMILLD